MTEYKNVGQLVQDMIDHRSSNAGCKITSEDTKVDIGFCTEETLWTISFSSVKKTLHELTSEYRKLFKTAPGRQDLAKQISAGLKIDAVYPRAVFFAEEREIIGYNGGKIQTMRVSRNGENYHFMDEPVTVAKAYCPHHDYSRHVILIHGDKNLPMCILCGAEMFPQLRSQLVDNEK